MKPILTLEFSSMQELKQYLGANQAPKMGGVTVTKKARKVRRSNRKPWRNWDASEDEFIQNNYGRMRTNSIAKTLNRSTNAVATRIHTLRKKTTPVIRQSAPTPQM